MITKKINKLNIVIEWIDVLKLNDSSASPVFNLTLPVKRKDLIYLKNNYDEEYYKYHSPYGNPGDEIYVVEDYIIKKICILNDKNIITVEYTIDDETRIFETYNSYSVTPQSYSNSFVNMPKEFVRFILIIDEIIFSPTNWIIKVFCKNL